MILNEPVKPVFLPQRTESSVVFPAPLALTPHSHSHLAPRIAVISPLVAYPLMCFRIQLSSCGGASVVEGNRVTGVRDDDIIVFSSPREMMMESGLWSEEDDEE